MALDLKKTLEDSYYRMLMLIDTEIENCPAELWDKKYGGDYYWQQVVHALGSCYFFLPLPDGEKVSAPFSDAVGRLAEEGDLSQPHDKELIKKFSTQVKEHIKNYFASITEADLAREEDFYGTPMSRAAVIMIGSAHIMYHAGALDAALRDNGAKAAM